MNAVATSEKQGEVGIITIDSPPVNAFGIAVREGLHGAINAFKADDTVKAIVVICAGRTFFAGADISEFGKPPQEPLLGTVFAGIEDAGKPVIAAIHGTALGGGCEFALVCNFRVSVPSAKLGLPEVKLGLLPGAGGTQRLPRIVGPELALDLMLSGRQVGANEALKLGLVDELVPEGALLEGAVAFANRVIAEGRPVTKVRDRRDQLDAVADKAPIFAAARAKAAKASRGYMAPENIIKAVEAAVTLPFDEGMVRERELFVELRDSTQSAAQRYYFFAERQGGKVPGLPADIALRNIAKVGVIGAGTMGGGITMNFLSAGIPVTLMEMTQEALDRGIGTIRRNYENSAKRGRITTDEVERCMALITPSLDMADLSDVDLVIEAVFERMDVKKDIFSRLDAVAKPGAILASNTSFLDLNEIAGATARPESVIGLHFFSPANVMRLLEIVRGEKTADDVLATSLKLAGKIGKVPVVSGVCDGFIANRIMTPRREQCEAVILEGTPPELVDKAIYGFGFGMGPFATMDLVGLDVINRSEPYRTVKQDLLDAGRRGQKSGAGYYDYDENRKATPSPLVANIIADVAAERGIPQSPPLSQDDLIARTLYPVVNEGARILEEGIAIRASDIDVACILGYNWPLYTGGPMFWADSVGLPKIVAELRRLASIHGPQFEPAPLLVKLAESGGSFTG
ncbi:3-hydroxyacyl-CoA dehydrogenase NAD-binding domain-containing protein [Novosphingobium colocasiae]|uniref:3-hydroxyacyl-CoA dehydrogenase n=1 Tax=Novosphingobium colocasiae TaxID=1256513 RepID=A0A918PPR7_9SPHN|nr:3-hydroxyacyl-CoA dehydrogenase NAD-binding domain-containing protein [Novosphingobium colocasiae]GGZ17516.1 3-hydroxyacyl-CoA dehydrogenase [Novosphingobium colocasiae]